MPTFTEELMQDTNLVEAINRVKAVMESHAEDDELTESLNTITRALGGKQDNLTFDSAPTSGSNNPVTSNGVKTALDGKQNKLTFDSTPTAGSSNPVTSGGVKNALNAVQEALIFDTEPTAGSTNPVTSNGIKAAIDAEASRASIAEASKVNKPETNPNGTQGQMLQSDGAGGTVWSDVGTPTDAQANSAISAWLNQHPEATTTVQDGSITKAKLANDIKDEIFTAEESILVDKSNINTAESGTLNVTLGQAFLEGVEYTVIIEASASQNRDSYVYWRNSSGNLNAIGYIPAGDTTATFVSTPSADGGTIRINSCIPAGSYRIIIKYSTDYSKIEQINTIVNNISETVKNIGNKTPISDLITFVYGYWNTVDSYKTNVNYRVMCQTPIHFTKDVIICARNGFGLSGYIDGTYFSNMGVIAVPASAELKLYIRRVWEDTSESADIGEFTTGIYILNYNASTEYDLMKSTFSGIEMFRSAGFIGDSYTATRLGYSWVDIVQNLTGVVCTKYAKSGADSGSWINASSYGLPALLSDTPKDLYWLALGINDGDRVDSNSTYLGSLSDLTGEYENYPDTFYGNTGHIIEAITAYAPDAKIVLYKPIFTSVKRTLSGPSATQNGLKQVRDAIGDIAEHYNLPVIDALDDPLYQSYWYSAHLDSAVSAGTHPSVMLYPAIAKANLRLFAKCVQNYDTYFMDLNYTTDLNL